MNQQVIDYIKKMREAGYADDGIKGLLLNAGHEKEDVQAAFNVVDGKNVVPLPPKSVNMPVPPSSFLTKKRTSLFSLVISVVIIIIMLKAGTVVLLNPSEMLAESEDTQRINDLNSLKITIDLLQAITDEKLSCAPGKIYKSTDGGMEIDGTGWLPVDFSKIPGGPPILKLDTDPVNDSKYFYSYACNSATNKFELDANLKSKKYLKENAATDGGNNPNVYETGTNLNIIK